MPFTYIAAIWQWFLRFAYVQLFLNLISLPILIWWGLPLSTLVLFGNLFFTPLLTLFLLLSSFVFFCELLFIPTHYLLACLERLGSVWTRLLEIPANTFLIALKPHFFLLITPFVAIAILFTKKLYTIERRLIALMFLMIINICSCFLMVRSIPFLQTINCNKGHITVLCTNNKLTLIDPGVMAQRTSAISWIQYTLLPYLAKTCGMTAIEHLIVLQPNKLLFEALAHLCTITSVKKVYIPYWQNNFDLPDTSGFKQMKNTLEKNGTTIIRYADKQIVIALDKTRCITIDSMHTKIKKPTVSYTGYRITTENGKHESCIYSHALRHKKPKMDEKVA
jgi:hypothetical protein